MEPWPHPTLEMPLSEMADTQSSPRDLLSLWLGKVLLVCLWEASNLSTGYTDVYPEIHAEALALRSMQRLDVEGGRVLAKKVIMFTDKQGRASEKQME